MKRQIALFLVLILTLFVFSSCTANQAEVLTPEPPPDLSQQTIRVASLKGPTTMGLVKLLEDGANGETAYPVESSIFGTADELTGLLVQGQIDAAAIPANLASVLYHKTEGKIQVAAINTLGVLYVVENGESIQSVEDLKGKTIYSTGKGTTPEYVLNTLLTASGFDLEKDITIEYKSEATEIASLFAEGQDIIAVLPQPYVTSVIAQNSGVRVALDITREWEAVTGDKLITGVLVFNKAFAEANPDLVAAFLADYEQSTIWVNNNPAEASLLIEKYGIVAKAALAEKAIPQCNITFITGAIMKENLTAYLQALMDQNPQSIGGKLPDDAFFYLAE